MKLGLSFLSAWEKGLKNLSENKTKQQFQKIIDILKFEKYFSYENKDIENFIKDLIKIYKSSNPLKRLNYLKRKVKVEQSFQIKSRRALFQTHIQIGFLSCFYFGVLIWILFSQGFRHLFLILFSLVLFGIGFLWILKIGRQMKWSI